MYAPALMAFLHHLCAFTVVGALAAEVVLFKPPLTATRARVLQRTDQVFGAAATGVLIVGFLRVFFFEKGAAYYFGNTFFVAKLSLFIVAALISIYPTVLFISWGNALRQGGAPQVSPTAAGRVRLCLMLELTAIVGILLCAPLMARGFGAH
jgi:putative membrane protein